VNAQFAVCQRRQGKRTGSRGLYLFAMMHHENESGSERVAGNRSADAQVQMQEAALATFTPF
jgi:hypothetical protein